MSQALLLALAESTAGQWFLILSLIFGGCCSNALALELATSQNPRAGTLITFAQFLIVSLFGLRKHLTSSPSKPMTQDKLVAQLSADILSLRESHGPNDVFRVGMSGADDEETARLADRVKDHITGARAGAYVTRASKPQSRGHLPEVPPGETTNSLSGTPADARHGTPKGSIMVMNGVGLMEGESKDEWDYTVLLASGGSTTDPSQASMIIDYSIPSAPIIISPHPPSSLFRRLFRLRFKRLAIPISRWLIQVVLFWATSLLNNLALGYDVSLAVHIIFRSGGLCSNMLLGWMIGKKYTVSQVMSVILVTVGVALATISSMNAKNPHISSGDGPGISGGSYAMGIALLTIALFMSSAMGLAQERAYNRYGRGHWEEGMFYLHFLGLPMFAFVGKNLMAEFAEANASSLLRIGPSSILRSTIPSQMFYLPESPVTPYPSGYPPLSLMEKMLAKLILFLDSMPAISIPSFYIPLVLNITTQLICVSGVHRLTSRVSSLTVTLVLVVRKAVSLAISVLWMRGGEGSPMLWGGAAAVLLGTVLYSLDGARQKAARSTSEKKDL